MGTIYRNSTLYGGGGSGSGGHNILDNDGNSLPQEDNLQFKGLSVTDNSTDEITEVEAAGLNQDDLDELSTEGITTGFVQSSFNYSTEEQIVGRWVDGKPLYQRTYSLTIPTSGDVVTTIPDISNIWITDIKATMNGNGSGTVACDLSRPYTAQTTPLWIRANGEIAMSCEYSGFKGLPFYLTIQYTKTTDAAGSATTTPGAYDINFPNTWPENTEIFFGNGVYGYRKTGSASGVGLVNIGKIGGLTKNGHLLSHGGYLQAPNSGNWDTGYFSVEVDDTSIIEQQWSSSSMSFTYNIWVTYTK